MQSSSRKVILAALAANIIIAAAKFTAAMITGSSAIFSEGIHSLVDNSNELLLLYGMRRAKQPPDEQFPFGHGKEVYFWSFIVAILIFAFGSGFSIFKGIDSLLHPHQILHPFLNYGVLLAAGIVEGGSWYIARGELLKLKGQRGYLQVVRRAKDPTIFVVFLEDTAALIGVATAFIGILLSRVTGSSYFDGVASIIIGLILVVTATILAVETKGLLIGESANQEVVKGIRDIARSSEGIEHVNEILTMHMGPEFILVNLSVNFVDSALANDIEAIVAGMDKRIKDAYPNVRRLFVEAEAWRRKK